MRLALIIAVESYREESGLLSLEGLTLNAGRLVNFFESQWVFDEIVFCCSATGQPASQGANRDELVSVVKKLLQDFAGEVDQLVLYVAGHGVSTPTSGGTEDLLLCSDYVDATSSAGCLSIQELTSVLARGLGAGDHLILTDLCRTESKQAVRGLEIEFRQVETGVANRFQISAARKGSRAENDPLFVDTILKSLTGQLSAEADPKSPRIRRVTYQSLSEDLAEQFAIHSRAWHTSHDGASNFTLLTFPASRKVASIRDATHRKIPPVRLLTYFDEIVFLGETNSQLAGIPRDSNWQVIPNAENFLEQALRAREGRKWKRLEIFSIEDLRLAGRPANRLEQLQQERDEAEDYLRSNAARLAEELLIFRYEARDAYGSFWTASNGERRLHLSRRLQSQDIRFAPSQDYVDFPGQPLPFIDDQVAELEAIRSDRATHIRFHFPNQAGKNGEPKAQKELPRDAGPIPSLGQDVFSSRAERAFRTTSPREVAGSKRAIIGPQRVGHLIAEAEEARQRLLAGKQPTPSQLASLEQAIRLTRPSLLCEKERAVSLPLEANWLASLWPRFQPSLQAIQSSVARLDRVDRPEAGKQGRSSWGTGFLVTNNLLMTANHVVKELSTGTGKLKPGQAIAEFAGYYGSSVSQEVQIVEVVQSSSELDLALLRLQVSQVDFRNRPKLLENLSRPVSEFPVCVIGFPLHDPRNPENFMSLLFENKFGVKRASIGEILRGKELILRGKELRFTHDCSTLGGNSGAPIIDVNTGRLCGVHVGGKVWSENQGVSADVADQFFRNYLATSPDASATIKIDPSVQDARFGPYRVFLSHGSEDTYIVNNLFKPKMENVGATVFVDQGGIQYGDDFRLRIFQELEHCDEIVVLLTHSSLLRPWVFAELGAGIMKKKRISAIRFGPSELKLQAKGVLSLLGTISNLPIDHFEAFTSELQSRIARTNHA